VLALGDALALDDVLAFNNPQRQGRLDVMSVVDVIVLIMAVVLIIFSIRRVEEANLRSFPRRTGIVWILMTILLQSGLPGSYGFEFSICLF
jgi:hypothetical protein